MTLDLARIVTQIDEMVDALDPEGFGERLNALEVAWRSFDDDDVNGRLDTARTSFLLARADTAYRETAPLPRVPDTYKIVSADGSMILPNRHSPARFYMINVGVVALTYGPEPCAQMESNPDLRCSESDLYVESASRRIPVNEAIVGLRRAVAELTEAARLTCAAPHASVTLLDGTLILWTLSAQDEAVVDAILEEYLAALSVFRDCRAPVASYISAPGAADVMNTMRVAVCDYPPRGMTINCDDCRRQWVTTGREPACDVLPNVTDGYLMREVARLKAGERTRAYVSQSQILERYGDEFRIMFFYVHTGTEIARVEVPAWVARDGALLDRVHAVVYDQCQLGRGYPVALQEAHEMAVISTADRQMVDALIERRLAAAGVTLTRTGKDGSKRGRFV